MVGRHQPAGSVKDVAGIEYLRADGIGDEAHDAERCEANDPLHDLRDRLREVIEHILRRVTGRVQRNAGKAGPAEDTDVVRRCQRMDWVVDDREDQVVQDLEDSAWRCNLRICQLQLQRGRK